MKRGTVVLDAGHGGTEKIGGSSPNNAKSPSGVMEKDVTLDLVRKTRDALRKLATDGKHDVRIFLTRNDDTNLGLSDRARLAKQTDADLFLSIHCNASDAHNARGVETLIRPEEHDNPNYEDDLAFARTIQTAVFTAVRHRDPKTRDRRVKDQRLGVLDDAFLARKTKACLVEVEFIDRTDVDELLNTGPNAMALRTEIAEALAGALLESLEEA